MAHRELRSRSASTEKRYAETDTDDLQQAEDSMDEYHRSQSNNKFVVVRSARDGKVRIIDYTRKYANSKLKLSEVAHASGAYVDEFAEGNVVYAHFPKTKLTQAGYYESHVVGVFDSQDKAWKTHENLKKGSTGKPQVVKATTNQSIQRLAALCTSHESDGSVTPTDRSFSVGDTPSEHSFADPSGSSFHSMSDTPTSPNGLWGNSFAVPTSPTTPTEPFSSVIGDALNSVSGIERNTRRETAVPILNVTNGLPVSTQEEQFQLMFPAAASSSQQLAQRQASIPLPNANGSFTVSDNNIAPKRKRSSRGSLPDVTVDALEKFHSRDTGSNVPTPAQASASFGPEIDYPRIHTQGGITTYEFSWSKRRDIHQVPLMPGSAIYVYPMAMEEVRLYAPTSKKPKITKYAWELVKSFFGGEQGVVKCYESQQGNYGIDKFLGETTVGALVVYIMQQFGIKEFDIGSFKATMNPKLNQLYKRKRGKYVQQPENVPRE